MIVSCMMSDLPGSASVGRTFPMLKKAVANLAAGILWVVNDVPEGVDGGNVHWAQDCLQGRSRQACQELLLISKNTLSHIFSVMS